MADDLLRRIAADKRAGKRGASSRPGGSLLDRVKAKRVTGADRQAAVEKRVAERPKAGPTSTLGVAFDDPLGDIRRGVSIYPGLGGSPLPAPNAPGGALFDLSESPTLGSAANIAESILGAERIARTPQDVHTPNLDVVGNIVAQLPQGVGLARGAALKAAPHLTPAGMKLAGPLIGAGVGAQQALRTEGLEDPAGIGTAALQGAGGAILPTSTWGQVAGQFGFDAVTGAAEVARRDPVLAERIASGRATPEEMKAAVSMLAVQTVPGVIGGAVSVGARGRIDSIRQGMYDAATGGRDNALRLKADLDAQEERLNAEQWERARELGLEIGDLRRAENERIRDEDAYTAARMRNAPELPRIPLAGAPLGELDLPTPRDYDRFDLERLVERDAELEYEQGRQRRLAHEQQRKQAEDDYFGRAAEIERQRDIALGAEFGRMPGTPLPDEDIGISGGLEQMLADPRGTLPFRPEFQQELANAAREGRPIVGGRSPMGTGVVTEQGSVSGPRDMQMEIDRLLNSRVQQMHDTGMEGLPMVGREPGVAGAMRTGELEVPTNIIAEIEARRRGSDLMRREEGLLALEGEPDVLPDVRLPDDFALPKRPKMTPLPKAPRPGQPIDWQRVIDEQKAAAIRERARKFIESRKAKTNAPQEVIQQEGVQGERPGGSPGGEAGEAGGGNRPLGEAPGGAPGRQAPGVGADTYLRGFSGKYRVVDTLSDGHLIVQSLDDPKADPVTVRPELATNKPQPKAKGDVGGMSGGSRGLGGRRKQRGFLNLSPILDVIFPKPRPASLNPTGTTISREIPAKPGKDFAEWWTRAKLRTQMLVTDDLAGILQSVKESGQKVPKRLNAFIAAEMVRYSHDRASAFLQDGAMLPDGRILGPDGGLRGIVHMPAGPDGTPIHKVLPDFEDYLIARRVASLADTRQDAVGEKARNGTLVPDMPLAKARSLVAAYEAQHPGFRAAGDALNSFFRAMLDYAEYQGRLNPFTKKAILDQNEFYVPLTREVDDPDAVDPFSVRLEGSEKHAVLPPIESTINAVDRIVRLADGNRVFRDMWDSVQGQPGNGWFDPLSAQDTARLVQKLGAEESAKIRDASGAPVAADAKQRKLLGEARLNRMHEHPIEVNGRYLVAGFVDGKRVFAEVDPVVYDSLKALQPKTRSMVTQVLLAPFRGMRQLGGKLITSFPGFIIANMLRGMSSRLLLSKRGLLSSLPGIEDARALKMMAEATPEDRAFMRMFRAFGPSFADESFVPQRETTNRWPWERGAKAYGNKKKFLKKYAPSAMRKTLRSPRDLYRWFMNYAEGAVRVPEFKGVYEAHLKENPGDTEGAMRAAFEASSRIGLNFRRGGTATKALNEYILFFNPAVQGTEQVLKALGTPRNLARGMMTLGATSLASMLLVGDDPDYQNLPDWEKDAYWYFPNPAYDKQDPESSKFVRVPKQPGFGVFTTPVETGMQLAMGDPNWARRLPFGEFVEETRKDKAVVDDLVNGLAMPVMKEIIDVFVRDRDSFMGREFTSVFDEAVIPSERYSIYSSPTMVRASRILSDNGVEIDPDKLEHLLGGIGQSAFDEALRASDQYIFDDPTIAASKKRALVVGRFFRDTPEGLTSLPVMRFFDEMERAESLHATYEAMLRRGEKERAQEFIKANDKAFKQAARVTATRDDVILRIRAARTLMAQKSIPPEEKQARLEDIGRVMTQRVEKYWKEVGNEPIAVK